MTHTTPDKSGQKHTRQFSLEPLESRQLMAAGGLDPSFSGDGKATFGFADGGVATAVDVAVQADGKTVAAGFVDTTTLTGSVIRQLAVTRFNFDGTPDTTFGPNRDGRFVTSLTTRRHDQATAVAVQRDGKIVVVGNAQTGSRVFDTTFVALRLLPNGVPDVTFDGDGARGIGFNGRAEDVALQSDGKIVVVGSHFDSGFLTTGDFNFAVARLNPNGSLDASFDGDGMRQVGLDGHDSAEAVAIAPDGKIVIAGATEDDNFAHDRIAVVRLNVNGTRDATFGPAGDGTVVTFFPNRPESSASAVTVDASGRIVVAGRAGDPRLTNGFDFALARYLPTGQLDRTFGTAQNGLVEVGFGGNDQAFDLVRTADGGFVVAGATNGRYALAALTASGTPKSNFGALGKVVTPDLVAATDGDVVFGGIARGPSLRFAVASGRGFQTARYLDDQARRVFVQALDPVATEGATDKATFIVSRTEALPVPTRVFFSIGGTADRPPVSPNIGTDYTLSGMTIPGTSRLLTTTTTTIGGLEPVPTLSGTPFVDIPAGATAVTVTLTATDDAQQELAETATFTILPSAGYELGPASTTTAKLDIIDNDGLTANLVGTFSTTLISRTTTTTSFTAGLLAG